MYDNIQAHQCVVRHMAHFKIDFYTQETICFRSSKDEIEIKTHKTSLN